MIDPSQQDLLFEVLTPLGFNVRVSRDYWNIIITNKHPVMVGCESIVQEVLRNPDEIRISRHDNTVFLFYRRKSERRYVCSVAKRLNGEGFLITTYLTDAVKEGTRVWPT